MTEIRIDMVAAEEYRRLNYGVLMVSTTEHVFTGPSIHNRHHGHVLEIWENRPSSVRRPVPGISEAYEGLVDPFGQPTNELYSFLWNPQPVVIALQPVETRRTRGEGLQLGDVARVFVNHYELGTIQCRAKSLHNPHGVLVDTASSASRQHYIETGHFLTPAEIEEYRS